MDPDSSGEELVVKTRKPYTITKQRERWTEEEHNKFLEALKLYGRAWQRIEEHIGTKTAVQIRSHAQKFFTKLEKEALAKGVPIGQALDIEIPPPRPKRKPNNPYPRKTNVGALTSQVGAKDGKLSMTVSCLSSGKQVLDLEKEPLPEKAGVDEKIGNGKKKQDEDNCSQGFSLFQEAPCASLSSANKTSMLTTAVPQNSSTFGEFVPTLKEVINLDEEVETNESYMTVEPKENGKSNKLDDKQKFQDNATCDTSDLGGSHPSHEKLVQGENVDELNHHQKYIGSSATDVQAALNCPRHVPVHILDGSLGMNTQNVSPDMPNQHSNFLQMGIHGQPYKFATSAMSTAAEHHNDLARSSFQSFPTIHPLCGPQQSSQDDSQSLLHLSSTFSSLIISGLLQNPAAHAAASFAATFWPYPNIEAPVNSPATTVGGYPSRQMNSAPSLAAIAAATVAAATAWWAAHGLLPLCAPFHPSFNSTPASVTATPMGNNKDQRRENNLDPALQDPQLNQEYSETLRGQHSTSKLPSLSSSDPEESEGEKLEKGLIAVDPEQAAVATEVHDSSKMKSRKRVDRSSCGSNTSSSSEVETDALEKPERDKEESKEPDVSHSAGDSSNRRVKSCSSASDSWKEVSEEGRLAFQALFSREVLPQSFSPPYDLKNEQQPKNCTDKAEQNRVEKNEELPQLDLKSKMCGSRSNHHGVENNSFLRNQNSEGLLAIGLTYGKLTSCRTGFKPYKRCSVEAKENRVLNASTQDEEKCPKRICLEREA